MSKRLCLTLDQIENTIMKVCDFVDKQREMAMNWEDFQEQRLWFELVSCILGSRVRYKTARDCTKHLSNVGLLNISNLLRSPRNAKNRIKKELNKPIYPPFSNGRGSKYRYPNSKSQCIITTAIQIYTKDNLTIKDILRRCSDGIEARDILIRKCSGIGPKQASLFLRNISFSEDLAILDCHVNRYMKLSKLDEKFNEMSNEKIHPYFKKENVLRFYAISKKRSLATLDIGIWTVMRLIEKETAICQL